MAPEPPSKPVSPPPAGTTNTSVSFPSREQKKSDTRQALFRSALALFAQHGYDSVTVDDIAARTGVSRLTFFRYHATKDAVLFGHEAQRLEALSARLEKIDARIPGHQRVRMALLALAARAVAQREELLAVDRVVRSSSSLIARQLELDTELEEALAQTLFEADGGGALGRLRADVCAAALTGAFRSTKRAWFDGGCADDLRVMVNLALDIVIHGVANRELTVGVGEAEEATASLELDLPDPQD